MINMFSQHIDESKSVAELTITENITCPITLQIFHTPVRLNCNAEHHIEKDIADKILASPDGICPCCRGRVNVGKIAREFKNTIDAFFVDHPEMQSLRYIPASPESKHEAKASSALPESKLEVKPLPAPSPRDVPYVDPSAEDVQEQQQILDSLQPRVPIVIQPVAGERKAPAVEMKRVAALPARVSQHTVIGSQVRDVNPVIKILILGDANSGKCGFLQRYMNDSFTTSFITTVGIDFSVKSIEIDGQLRKLQIWDTAGQERFRTITTAYFRGAKAAFLMYNISDMQSFENIASLKKQVEDHAADNIVLCLVGTGDGDAREVSVAQGQDLASLYQIPFFECSVKANINIKEAFEVLVRAVICNEPPQAAPMPAAKPSSSCIVM